MAHEHNAKVSQLERELAEAKRDKEALSRFLTDNPSSLGAQIVTLRQQLAAVEKERDELHVQLCAKSAELGEANAKVKDLTDMSVKMIIDGIDKQAQSKLTAAEAELAALRQWSEQAGEAMQLLMDNEWGDERKDGISKARALLATHPASQGKEGEK